MRHPPFLGGDHRRGDEEQRIVVDPELPPFSPLGGRPCGQEWLDLAEGGIVNAVDDDFAGERAAELGGRCLGGVVDADADSGIRFRDANLGLIYRHPAVSEAAGVAAPPAEIRLLNNTHEWDISSHISSSISGSAPGATWLMAWIVDRGVSHP